MSEPTYPPAWGVLHTLTDGSRYWKGIAPCDPGTYPLFGGGTSESVELIPRPEVDRLIAEAVAVALSPLREHAAKTRKSANDRIRNIGSDGHAMQLDSEAGLLEMILHQCEAQQ